MCLSWADIPLAGVTGAVRYMPENLTKPSTGEAENVEAVEKHPLTKTKD